VDQANENGRFVTLQSYEIHSSHYGDHHIVSPSPDLPLVEASSPWEIIDRVAPRDAIAIPHHIGYVSGYRGINWDTFRADTSPVVEVYSKHGSGMSDNGPFPYLHTMGPRDGRNTVTSGLARGNRFGFVASTDHHAGYPGSYGDGRLAVLATARTRQAVWEAICARRTYAVTGDKIECALDVDGHPMGSQIGLDSAPHVRFRTRCADAIDKIIVYRNGFPWQVVAGETLWRPFTSGRCLVRVEMGWGRSPEPFTWSGQLKVRGGRLVAVQPCFRGRSILAPQEGKEDDPDGNRVIYG